MKLECLGRWTDMLHAFQRKLTKEKEITEKTAIVSLFHTNIDKQVIVFRASMQLLRKLNLLEANTENKHIFRLAYKEEDFTSKEAQLILRKYSETFLAKSKTNVSMIRSSVRSRCSLPNLQEKEIKNLIEEANYFLGTLKNITSNLENHFILEKIKDLEK